MKTKRKKKKCIIEMQNTPNKKRKRKWRRLIRCTCNVTSLVRFSSFSLPFNGRHCLSYPILSSCHPIRFNNTRSHFAWDCIANNRMCGIRIDRYKSAITFFSGWFSNLWLYLCYQTRYPMIIFLFWIVVL